MRPHPIEVDSAAATAAYYEPWAAIASPHRFPIYLNTATLALHSKPSIRTVCVNECFHQIYISFNWQIYIWIMRCGQLPQSRQLYPASAHARFPHLCAWMVRSTLCDGGIFQLDCGTRARFPNNCRMILCGYSVADATSGGRNNWRLDWL